MDEEDLDDSAMVQELLTEKEKVDGDGGDNKKRVNKEEEDHIGRTDTRRSIGLLRGYLL